MTEYTAIHDARDDLYTALRYASSIDEVTRARIERAHSTLVDLTRSGNLSPTYLLAQDRAMRKSAALSGPVDSAERGA